MEDFYKIGEDENLLKEKIKKYLDGFVPRNDFQRKLVQGVLLKNGEISQRHSDIRNMKYTLHQIGEQSFS